MTASALCPNRCRFKRFVNVRNAVLCGHAGMQMKFNAFDSHSSLPFKRNQAYVVYVKSFAQIQFCHALYEQVVSLPFAFSNSPTILASCSGVSSRSEQ